MAQQMTVDTILLHFGCTITKQEHNVSGTLQGKISMQLFPDSQDILLKFSDFSRISLTTKLIGHPAKPKERRHLSIVRDV